MRIFFSRSRTLAAAVVLLLAAASTAGCSERDPGRPDDRTTVWSLESLPPRMEATKKIVAGFEKRTGIRVKLVGVSEDQLPQPVMSAAAAGTGCRP
jgi:multiple sugar transport system substrate-binding protein